MKIKKIISILLIILILYLYENIGFNADRPHNIFLNIWVTEKLYDTNTSDRCLYLYGS